MCYGCGPPWGCGLEVAGSLFEFSAVGVVCSGVVRGEDSRSEVFFQSDLCECTVEQAAWAAVPEWASGVWGFEFDGGVVGCDDGEAGDEVGVVQAAVVVEAGDVDTVGEVFVEESLGDTDFEEVVGEQVAG